MAKRSYHMLFARIETCTLSASQWGPEFGDYDLETVQFERDNYRDKGIPASCLRIITLPNGTAKAVREATAKLNGKAR